MKKYIIPSTIAIVTLIAIIMFISNQPEVTQTQVSKSGSLQASAFMARIALPNVTVIDIRTAEEFESGHIEQAINIDFYASDFRDQISNLDKNKSYAIYCRSGNRSGQALTMMKTLGFTDVIDLDGGIISL